MSTEINWENHNIHISCQLVPKYLWMATETVIDVDNIEIGRCGGFGLNERISGEFTGKSFTHKLILDLKANLLTFTSVPYKLQIDGNLISEGKLKFLNWPLFIVPIVLLAACVFCSIQIFLSFWIANSPAG